jgi:Tfp pilus assembly protein PilN
MQAIKIATHIKNGVITLPLEYQHLNQDVEIIVLGEHLEDADSEQQEAIRLAEKKQRFFEALEGLKEIKSFREIEDPVKWQKELRDEWES